MSVLFGPVIGMIHNTARNTWHPVVFVESPLPGLWTEYKPVRHKSKMHHTSGFSSRDEAAVNARTDLFQRVRENSIGEPRLALAEDFEWDGEGVPTISTVFAPTPDGLLVSIFA